MKKVKKFITHNLLVFVLCGAVLIVFNLILFALWGAGISKDNSVQNTPWMLADATSAALQKQSGRFVLNTSQETDLRKKHVWAMLIDNTCKVVWSTNLPGEIPKNYTISDIAELSRTYLNGYPTFTSPHKEGLVVLGYQKNSYLKVPRNNLNNTFLANMPAFLLIIFLCDAFLFFLIYIVVKKRLLFTTEPLIKGLEAVQRGEPVHLEEKGPLSQVAASINQIAKAAQEQPKKHTQQKGKP